MRVRDIALGIAAAALVTACAGPRSQTVRLGDTKAVATRGDLRVLTERPDPHRDSRLGRHQVVCAEPSPDVALALSTTLQLQANAKTSGVDATASASHSTSEAVIALAGRTAAVVALRDSLFRACEAYANGVIGRDAYGLILSQYGDLLVTLMLGEDAAASAHAPTAAAAGAGAADPVAAIADRYMMAAADRRRAAAFVLCTMAAEREREASGGAARPVDPLDPHCGGVPPATPGR